MFIALFIFVSSTIISLGFVGLLIKYFDRDLLDIPNQRSTHTRPTLRGGGLGFIVAFAITGLVAILTDVPYPGFSLTNYFHIWLVLIPLTIIGFIDDCQSISASNKYFVQLLSAITTLLFFGTIPLPVLSHLGMASKILTIVFTLVAVTALINFYNFMDGLDGFVASITAVQLGFLAFYLKQPIFFLLVAALIGFLWWNWFPAKIFMGDVGSTFLGASVAILLLSSREETVLAWSALSVTFPLIGDSIYTLIRRLLNKENIFEPHRIHIYQRLQQSNLGHDWVTFIYIFATIVTACVVYWLGIMSVTVNILLTILAISMAEVYLINKPINK